MTILRVRGSLSSGIAGGGLLAISGLLSSGIPGRGNTGGGVGSGTPGAPLTEGTPTGLLLAITRII
jgi:hypothetical protein